MLRFYISHLYTSCHDRPSLLSVLDLHQLCSFLVFVHYAFAIYRFNVVVICKIDHFRSISSFTSRIAQSHAPSASSGMHLSMAIVNYRLSIESNCQNPLLYIPSLLLVGTLTSRLPFAPEQAHAHTIMPPVVHPHRFARPSFLHKAPIVHEHQDLFQLVSKKNKRLTLSYKLQSPSHYC
jgi:hypothetical protein